MISRIDDRRPVSLSLADQLTQKIVSAREAATQDDRERVEYLVRKAIGITNPADKVMEESNVTPGMGAILFLDHNGFNREWHPSWTADYSVIMNAGQWRGKTSDCYGLYSSTADVGNGAHRMAAQAVSGVAILVYFLLGMSREDVASLDCGRRRTPADAAMLAGVANAKAKSTLLRAIWGYEKAAGLRTDAVPSANVRGIADKIQDADPLLSRALEIGASSGVDAADPLVSEHDAAKIAGVMLRAGWDEDRIAEYLTKIQTGGFVDEKDPLLFAREFIVRHRKPADVISPQKEAGILIKGVLFAETGVEITSTRSPRLTELHNAAKHAPDPRPPAVEPEDEAAE